MTIQEAVDCVRRAMKGMYLGSPEEFLATVEASLLGSLPGDIIRFCGEPFGKGCNPNGRMECAIRHEDTGDFTRVQEVAR